MRIRARIARLFMDQHQRALTDPSQYKTPVKTDTILWEIRSGCAGRMDHETYGAMKSAAGDIGAGGTLSIADAVAAKQSFTDSMSRGYDNSLHEWAVIANLGNHALVAYLIKRANLLAKGIQPGAEAMLADAFGVTR